MLSAHASCLQASKVQPSSSNPDVSWAEVDIEIARTLWTVPATARVNMSHSFYIACVLVRRVTYVAGCSYMTDQRLPEPANSSSKFHTSNISQQFMAPRRLYISTPLSSAFHGQSSVRGSTMCWVCTGTIGTQPCRSGRVQAPNHIFKARSIWHVGINTHETRCCGPHLHVYTSRCRDALPYAPAASLFASLVGGGCVRTPLTAVRACAVGSELELCPRGVCLVF